MSNPYGQQPNQQPVPYEQPAVPYRPQPPVPQQQPRPAYQQPQPPMQQPYGYAQPQYQQPPHGYYQQPYQQGPYQQPGYPQVQVNVNNHGGPYRSSTSISSGVHAIHGVLTFFTCGLWGFVWLAHWFFTKSETRHY